MFKNKLPLSSLISMAVISIGLFVFLFSVSDYQERELKTDFYSFVVLGLFLLITGILIFLRKKWARIILTISLLGLMFFLIYPLIHAWYGLKDIAQLSLFVGLPLFLILLLYNDKVSIEFGDKHTDKELEDILDHFE